MTVQEAKDLNPEAGDFVPSMLDFMIENIPHEFHLRKAMEECFEVGEVLAKIANKSEHNRPSRTRLIEEGADLLIRYMCVIGHLYKDTPETTAEQAMEEGGEALGEAVEAKLRKIQDWLKEGKIFNLKM